MPAEQGFIFFRIRNDELAYFLQVFMYTSFCKRAYVYTKTDFLKRLGMKFTAKGKYK